MVELANASLDDEVRALFAGQRLEDPWPVWNRMREEAPVYRGDDMAVLCRYSDVKAVLPDRKRFTAEAQFSSGSRAAATLASVTPETARKWKEIAKSQSFALSQRDIPNHDRMRKIVHRFFTPRQMQSMEPDVQRFWDEILEAGAEQEIYDHKHGSQSLALRVITNLVGCPDVDAPKVADMVERLAYFQYTRDENLITAAYEARLEFNDYIENVILAGYRHNPDSNEFVRAVMDARGEENLSREELCATISELLFGGIETTAVLLSTGLLTLLQHRDQWEWLCEDPVARVPTAVEELFRYVAPAQTIPRRTLVDIELDGVEIPEGFTVIASIAAAHRDPAQYENPDTLDIRNARAHLGLGLGPKFCLGASVIRTEARIAFTTLAQRFPNSELAIPEAELDWSGGPMGVRSLHVHPVALQS